MTSTSLRYWLLALIAGTLFQTGLVSAAETGSLDDHLEPFRPFLGKTWRGQFKDSKPDSPTVDVARWERALNGKAVRVLHSVNAGAYGGESLIVWDKERSQIVYYYFTTAGFYTTGSVTIAGGKFTATEKVNGNKNGLTEVRSTYELRPDGTLASQSQYFKGAEPAGGREVVYQEDPKAEVEFR